MTWPPTPMAAALIAGIISFVVRYAVTGAIENDHFVTFARALQVMHGDWPVRDFDDPGFPLSYLLSTAVALAFGPSLLVNVLLCILLLALTSALTYVLTFRATQSHFAAALATAVTIVVYPRLYNATKVIVPVVAIWLSWRYADGGRRLGHVIELAVWTAIAFLLRHDYFVYVAVGNVALLALCHANAPRVAIARLLTYVLLTLLFIAPWLLYVQVYEGLAAYFASALRFTAAEGRRTATGPLPWMFFAFIAIPVVGILASLKRGPHLSRAQLASAAVMLLSLDLVFLRDVLATRIPDVVAPTVVVAAAAVCHLIPNHAMKRTATLTVTVAFVAVLVAMAITRPAIPGPPEAAHRFIDIGERLRRVSPEITPNPTLAPVVTYLTQCTSPDDRVLVAGFGPEIPVLAHRPFAARLPTWIPGYYEDDADVSRALAKLRGERVGAAVFLDGTNAVARSWPALLQAIRERAFDEYEVARVNSRLRVWLPHRVAESSRDTSTDLPCPGR